MLRLPMRLLAVLACFGVAGFFLCTKNPVVHVPTPNTGKTSNGYFYILAPTTGDSIAFDSTITIEWLPSQNVSDTAHVKLFLFNDTHQVCVISPSCANTGSLTWSAPNSGAGTKYHIKICVLPDSQHFDFGNFFSFYDPYNGTITVTKPDSSSRLTLDSSFTIQWTSTGFSGASLKLSLYDDTALVSTIVDRMMTAVHSYSWSTIATSLGSGTRYRIKATSDFDTSIYSYSQYFTIASQFWGSFTVKSPTDSSTWTSGNTYKIQWDTTGHPGPLVLLQLYNDTVLSSTIAATAPDIGSFSWPIPQTATSGTKYRIKITSTGDGSITAFSKKFTIKGIDPDSYEPDNVRDSASSLTPGTLQNHTITLNDTDWVKFTADSGSRYVITDSGYASYQTSVPLFYARENTYTSYNFSNGSGLLRWMWSCEKSGTFYARISSLAGGNTGAYSFRIAKFDSTALIAFTAPVSGSKVSSGSSFAVTWQPDSAMLGTSVYIYLYKGNIQLLTLTPSSVPDNGSYSWSVSSGLASGSDYRIKIANANNGLFFGVSQVFTLTGMAADTFEYDDIKDSASVLSAGVAQQHSITMADTDWIRLAPDSGSTYLFQVKGASSFQTTINLFHGTEAGISALKVTDTSGSALWLWVCDKPSPWYARVFATVSGGYGTYSFKMTKFDSLSSITFTNPTASSKWYGTVAYSISWTPDTTILGPTVSLHLVKSGVQSTALSVTSAPNSGTYSWTVPATITPGSDYRIRIANVSNTQLFGLSPQFTLSDIMPDTFEVDDVPSQASTLALATAQQHTLTYADTDWIKFSADSGSRYILVANGSAGYKVSGTLFYNTNTAPEASFTSGTNGIAQTLWACAKSGTYYSKVFSYTAGATGRYSFGVQPYDSSTIAAFTSPTAGIQWSTDSTYTIRWTADTVLFGKLILLYAYKTDLLSMAITATSVSNTGTCSWTVPSGLASGTDYRIRLVNASNAQMYGCSPVFSIKGMTPDAYEPDNPRSLASALVFGTPQQHSITYNDTDWVKFSADSGSLYFIRDTGASLFRTYVYLYYNTDVTTTASNYSLTTGSFSWAWSCTKSGTYNARITPYTAGTTGTYSLTATKFDTLTSLVFNSPLSTSAFTAGSANTISWVPDTSILGTNSYLYLYKANKLLLSISTSYVPNSGTYSWTDPTGLVTGNDYRVKIVSYASTVLYGYSAAFTISGMAPDSYEPDNIRAQASTLTLGTSQQHNITYADTDWTQFSADSGSLYIIQDNGASSFNTNIALYYGADANYTSQNSTSAGSLSWLWSCVKTGTYGARITPAGAAVYGSYSFRVSYFDPSKSITFTNPTSTTTWTAGATDTIRWVPDSSILGTSVYLYFFKGNQQLYSLTSFSVPNSGSFSLQVPSGFMTGNDYRIKIANYSNSLLIGYSPLFSITGVAADSYEPDNIRSQASALTFGTVQQHTLTFADSDWIQFSTDSGSLFSVRVVQEQTNPTMVDMFNGSDAAVASPNSNNLVGTSSWIWKSLKNGTWYARVTAPSVIYGGPYSFSMTKFDTMNTVQFTNPTAASVVVAGQPQSISWKPDSIFYGSMVDIYLTKGFAIVPVYVYSGASITNNGTLSWTPPAGLPTGTDYRIRMIDYPYAALVSYSPAFTINGMTPDSYEPDNIRSQATALTLGTAQQHNLTYADSDWVRFGADSGSKYMIQDIGVSSFNTGINLYYSTDVNYTAQNNTPSGGSLTWIWPCVKSGTYYAWIYPYSSGTYGSYSFKTTLLDTLTMITFTNPASTTTWTGGTTYTVSWVPDSAILGSTVSLYLTKGNKNIVSLSQSAIPNSGSFSYQVPSGMATGSDYRVKIVNYAASQFFGYSQAFSINGMTSDSYEPDNSRAQSSALTLGTAQLHNITYADSDWIHFSADSGSTYIIRDSGISSFTTNVVLYYSTDATYSAYNVTNTNGSLTWLWKCLKSGTYCAWIVPNSATTVYGSYSFKVTLMDTLSMIAFTNPTSSTTWSGGSTYTVTWQPDTALLGSIVAIYLTNGTGRALNFSSSAAPDNGSYSLQVPAGVATGSDYRIKIINYNSPQFYAYSPAFSVNGMASDSYEPDDARSQASAFTLGMSQQHTITFGDTDWVQFPVESGSQYFVQGAGASYFTISGQMFLGNSATANATFDAASDGTYSLRWTSAQTTTCAIRLNASLSVLSGAYSLKIRKLDSLSTVVFSSPTSSTAWAAGSSQTIQWEPNSDLLTNDVSLAIYKGDQFLISASGSMTTNNGSRTVSLPLGLANGSDYRIQIHNYYSPVTFTGYSQNFAITGGVTPDAYEPDSLQSLASTLTLGAAQQHTFSYNDVDWVKFSAVSGTKYLVQTPQAKAGAVWYLYDGSSQNYIAYEPTTTFGLASTWKCTQSGTYFFKLVPYNTLVSQSSPFVVSVFDSTRIVNFLSPAVGSSITAGTTIPITWTPDSVMLSTWVELYLYKGNQQITSTSPQPNNGSYNLITAPAVAGADYRIKLLVYQTDSLYGYSPYFTIH